MFLLAAASLAAGASSQSYPRSSRLPRAEVKVNETFVNNAVHGYGSWRIACPSERVPAGPAGTVPSANVCYVTYMDADPTGIESVRFRRSVDGGLTWGAGQILYTLPVGEVFSSGDTRIVASEHDVFVVWASNGHTLAAGEQAVFAVGSNDQGQTWSAPTLLTPEFLTGLRDADEVNVAISRNGAAASLNVVFEADTPAGGNEDVYFVQAELQAGALTVTVPTTRLNAGYPVQSHDVDYTAIAADGPVVHVVWCDDRSGVSNDYFSMTSRNNGTDWATT
ncbi:MAG: exo-alpha-sialidase, partial [Planctomycetes bacterium]|nr:exo-alpha-sialidase [Planctomycetota bacterium]